VKVGDDKVQELLSEKEIFEEEKKEKGLTTKCKLKNQEPENIFAFPCRTRIDLYTAKRDFVL
jgi:hypothetical protein